MKPARTVFALLVLACGTPSSTEPPPPRSAAEPTSAEPSSTEPLAEATTRTALAGTAYRALLSRTAGLALERQLHLADVIGERSWTYDVDTGELTFGADLVYHAEILGSESTSAGTWLWSWANEASRLPSSVTRVASRLRQHGREHEVAELREAELSLDRVTGQELAMIAVGLGEGGAYYRGPHEGGAVLLIITDERFGPLPDPEPARWMTLMAQLPLTANLDQRVAYESLLRARGFEVDAASDTIRARRPGVGELTLSFDAQDRMVQLDGLSP